MLELDTRHWREESEGVYVRRRPKVPVAVLLGLCAVLGMDLIVACAGFQQAQMASAAAMPDITPPYSQIPGLDASESMITGVVDPDSLTASYYWTFVVHNATDTEQEAQIQLQLPEAATVSRATLWVNGQPEEAAFNATNRVQGAYNWITKQHRDPLLVTQTGPGLISVKAAPVRPHQNLQFRLGITAAGELLRGQANYRLPYVTKSNLDMSCPQNVHLTSQRQFEPDASGLNAMPDSDNGFLLRGSLRSEQLRCLLVSTGSGMKFHDFATRATHSLAGTYIAARLQPAGFNYYKMVLSKTRTLTKGTPVIDSDEMAHRLSSLWAFGEIERVAGLGNDELAGQLATTYRIVSCVSGATVLELQSDYYRWDLTRDPYQVLSYEPNDGFIRPIANRHFYYQPEAAIPAPTRRFMPNTDFESGTAASAPFQFVLQPFSLGSGFGHGALQATMSQSFSTVVQQLNALNSYSATSSSGGSSGGISFSGNAYSVPSFPTGQMTTTSYSSSGNIRQFAASAGMADIGNSITRSQAAEQSRQQEYSAMRALSQVGEDSGLIGWSIAHGLFFASKRDGSLFMAMFGSPDKIVASILAINALLLLLTANFAGPAYMLIRAFQACALQEQEVSGWTLGGLLWLATALICPTASQVLLLIILATNASCVPHPKASEANNGEPLQFA